MNRLLAVTLILLALPTLAPAQPWVRRNPQAVTLRALAVAHGPVYQGRFGDGGGGVGDLNHDGYADFMVHSANPSVWRLFHGGPTITLDTTWTFAGNGTTPIQPLVGDFYGTGEKLLGLGQ